MEKQKEADPKQKQLLRFSDLVTLGLVRNRATLGLWIRNRGFPRGRLLGGNTRVWPSDEIWAWIDQQAIAPKLTPRTGGRRRKVKSDNEVCDA